MPRSTIRLIVLRAQLERELRRELRRPAPDADRIARIEGLKVAIRARLAAPRPAAA